jgi:hypothetical protein
VLGDREVTYAFAAGIPAGPGGDPCAVPLTGQHTEVRLSKTWLAGRLSQHCVRLIAIADHHQSRLAPRIAPPTSPRYAH